MPIVFRCEHCTQKLRVSSRKAGHRGKCPKCEQPFTVPTVAVAPTPSAKSPTATPPPVPGDSAPAPAGSVPTPPPPPEPVTSFVAITTDDETEILYDDQEFDAPHESYGHVDPRKVAVSRKILIAQGVLLAVVAVCGFAFGLLIGRGGGGSTTRSGDGMPTPCVVTGKISYTTESGQKFPDEGAVVYIVPQSEKPDLDEKIAPAGLRPTDALPGENHAGLQMIRQLGGAHTRADANGDFRLRLPRSGKFFVLVISKSGRRKSNVDITRADLAQMGRYFLPVTDLVTDRRYRWLSEEIYHDRRLNVVLE